MNITKEANLAAQWILDEKVIAYPTEGVWGIGCINNQSVISKLSEIKQRPKDKKYILLFRSVDDLRKKFEVKKDYIKQIKELSNSFTTIIVPLNKNNSIAVRIPKTEILQDLLEEVGEEIVSTSANISGTEYTNNLKDICNTFKSNEVALFNHRLGGISKPSKIIMLKSKKVIRE